MVQSYNVIKKDR